MPVGRRIAELVREKKIEGIADLRDESDRDGYRVVVELKRDAVPEVVLNQLYKFTPLQTNFGANMVALDGGRPQVMNLKDLLTVFIAFRESVVSRAHQVPSEQGAAIAHTFSSASPLPWPISTKSFA